MILITAIMSFLSVDQIQIFCMYFANRAEITSKETSQHVQESLTSLYEQTFAVLSFHENAKPDDTSDTNHLSFIIANGHGQQSYPMKLKN